MSSLIMSASCSICISILSPDCTLNLSYSNKELTQIACSIRLPLLLVSAGSHHSKEEITTCASNLCRPEAGDAKTLRCWA